MQRITIKDLQALCDELNEVTGSPMKPYAKDSEGRMRAQVGNYHISQAYGGVCLHRMYNEGGGVTCPLYSYHDTKRKLCDAIRSMLSGIYTAREAA